MYGSRAPATSSQNQRSPLKAKRPIIHFQNAATGLLACLGLFFLFCVNSAFGQAVHGPVRITLEEAIQMASQHNHNMLAARTTIQQSEAAEVTANMRPNPALFADWE